MTTPTLFVSTDFQRMLDAMIETVHQIKAEQYVAVKAGERKRAQILGRKLLGVRKVEEVKYTTGLLKGIDLMRAYVAQLDTSAPASAE
jgi:hypothetical protein